MSNEPKTRPGTGDSSNLPGEREAGRGEGAAAGQNAPAGQIRDDSAIERAARLRKVRREVRAGMGAERLDVELLESELARVEAERDAARADADQWRKAHDFHAANEHFKVMNERDAALAELERQKKHNELQAASLRQANERIQQLQRALDEYPKLQAAVARLSGAARVMLELEARRMYERDPEADETTTCPCTGCTGLRAALAAPEPRRSPSFADIPAPDPEADARIDELMAKQMRTEGDELRREIERRVAPMKRGPFLPPTGGKP